MTTTQITRFAPRGHASTHQSLRRIRDALAARQGLPAELNFAA